MSIKELFTTIFRDKNTDEKIDDEKPVADEHELQLIHQKMAMLNGRYEHSH